MRDQGNQYHFNRFALSFFILVLLIFFQTNSYAVPFSIVPSGALPTLVVTGETVTAAYSVRNNTASQRNANVVKYLPPNVAIDSATGCGSTFNLAAKGESGDTCILNLIISGAVNANDPNPNHHLFVCFPGGKTCAGTNFPLNVTESSSPISSRVTVGSYIASGSIFSPLSYLSADAGTSWTATFPPKTGNLSQSSELISVSCGGNARSHCTAVGYYSPLAATNRAPISYISVDGGSTWTSSIPTQAGDTTKTSPLSGVSCQGGSNQYCTSVGAYTPLGLNNTVPITYYSTNSGTTWTSSLPTPQGDTTITSSLAGISCNGSTGLYCTTVGNYTDLGASAPSPVSYYSTTGGIAWIPSIPAPQGDTTQASALQGVSCTGSTGQNCVAVGFYTPLGSSTTAPITYTSTNAGASWTASIPTAQGDTTQESQLIGVNCVGANCVAVGYYTTLTGNTAALAYVSTNGGTTWTATFPPEQGGSPIFNQLSGVFCTGSTGQSCTTVGFYLPSGASVVSPLTYLTEDGGSTWTVSIPAKQGLTSANSLLYSIS